MSATTTTRRGLLPGRSQRRSKGSPPRRAAARRVERRSGRSPRRGPGRWRRAGRSGPVAASRRISRVATTRSRSEYSEKSLSRKQLDLARRRGAQVLELGRLRTGEGVRSGRRAGGSASRAEGSSRSSALPRGTSGRGLAHCSKAASKIASSSRLEQIVARIASLACSGSATSIAASARSAPIASEVPATSPRSRSSARNLPSRPVELQGRRDQSPSRTERSRTPLEVLADLERRAEGRLEVLAREGEERSRPVDRLADPRQLVELLAAQPCGGRADPLGQLTLDPRQPGREDLSLPGRGRVVDPVVEAAALQGVVQLAGPVGGDHDERSASGGDRAELGNRHLEVGEQLQQKGLELVVSPVELVDQQDQRPLVVERLEQRPAQQEALAE